MFEPVLSKLRRVKSAISASSWIKLVEQARQAEEALRRILEAVAGGLSLNAAWGMGAEAMSRPLQ